ncbi:MAG: ubiquinone biosynthesis monooxygenase Coq7 [Candidatus Azotimanducaceae bacterium]|jgi:ubiquinone biosynthesis monooxygenase Coq7
MITKTVTKQPRNSLTTADHFIAGLDSALRTISGAVGHSQRSSPATDAAEPALSAEQRLNRGQALTAKNTSAANALQSAAEEEADHLAWCQTRLRELDAHVSFLNPFWYAASFSMGAITGLLGDKINLGFVAATEEEVCKHLDKHLAALPSEDSKSRLILTQMREDERRHQDNALELGGAKFPAPVKAVMQKISGLMTRSTHWI